MKFTHQGIEIDLQPSGDFVATVEGQRVVKASLDAMKKHIATAKKKPFAAFTAMREETHRDAKKAKDGLVRVTAIGIKRRAGRHVYYGQYEFVLEGDSNELTRLFVDTPENRQAFKALEAHREESRRIEEQRKAERAKLQEAIKYHVADEFHDPKVKK